MGCEALKRQSKDQLTKQIQLAAKLTKNVIVTTHAKTRMRERKVTMQMVYECLRQGQMRRRPEENVEYGTLECRMERYCAGCDCTLIVALQDENPDLICVTVWV